MAEGATGPRITVTENGPYLVEGNVPIARQTITPNEKGESWEWTQGEVFETGESYRLCRCGNSKTKPFCDDTHLEIGFDGTESASRAPYLEQAEVYPGAQLELTDAEVFCASARFCDAGRSLWTHVTEEDPDTIALAERQGVRCPSGRLVVWRKEEGGNRPVEGGYEPSIGVIEDPAGNVSGPYWVRGHIPVFSADGTPYEVRERQTLDRCGASQNKPFCDSSHYRVQFRDETVHGEPQEA